MQIKTPQSYELFCIGMSLQFMPCHSTILTFLDFDSCSKYSMIVCKDVKLGNQNKKSVYLLFLQQPNTNELEGVLEIVKAFC